MKIERARCDGWDGCGRPVESWWSAFKRAWQARNDPPPKPVPMTAQERAMMEELRPVRVMNVLKNAYPVEHTITFVNVTPPITDEDGGRRGD